MATPKVIPFPSAAQVPQTIPQEVPQAQLAAILELRREARRIQEQLTQVETEVKQALEVGAEVEPGNHIARLKEHFRRAVAWREIGERLADRLYGNGRGFGYCEGVLKSTKPTRTVSLHVA